MKPFKNDDDVNVDAGVDNNNNNDNETTIAIEVGEGVIDRVCSGETTHIAVEINDDNQNVFLQNFDGHLLLCTEELPDTYHGCYYYNGGVFPYILKDTYVCLILTEGDRHCLTQIVSKRAEAGTRFRFQGPGEPSVEDPNGDSCIWQIEFEVVPVMEKPKTYLMRWNPSISSFSEGDYQACVENMQDGVFRINWSIFEWEEARRGDFCFMMRVGDDKAGIVFKGVIVSDPYVRDDWAGSSKRRLYVDLVCRDPVAPGDMPDVSLEKLSAAIPEFEWAKGHSGVLLSEDVAERLLELWNRDID